MRVVEEAEYWIRVGGRFIRNPLGYAAAAIWSYHGAKGAELRDPQRAEWVRKREKEIDRTHAQRRRQGTPARENALLRGREISALYEELRERRRQAIYPFGPRE